MVAPSIIPPTSHIEQPEARKVYEEQAIPIGTLPERIAHVVQCAFGGRRIVIFSGGVYAEESALMDEIRGINQGGGFGSIIGRNSFQRPKNEALRLLGSVIDTYLDK